jgi:hypothetical protein
VERAFRDRPGRRSDRTRAVIRQRPLGSLVA